MGSLSAGPQNYQPERASTHPPPRAPGVGTKNVAARFAPVVSLRRGEKGVLVGTLVVSLHGGEYDIWRREELRSELDAIDASGDVIIDLNRITFMDAGAIGLLLSFRRRVRENNENARVTLRNTPPIVMRVLKLSRADQLFEFTS